MREAAVIKFKHILCAIDSSPSSLRALRYALELGRQADGCVTTLYALEYMDPEEPWEHVDFDIPKRRQHFIDRAYKGVLQQARTSKAHNHRQRISR